MVPVCCWEDACRSGPDTVSGLVQAKSVTSMLGNDIVSCKIFKADKNIGTCISKYFNSFSSY